MKLLSLLAVPALLFAQNPHADQFTKTVAPFLARNCNACHNEKVANADLNLARFANLESALAERNVWEDVLDKLRSGEMPPPPFPAPNAEQLLPVSRWLERQVARRDATAKPDPGRVTARRLNKVEYNLTIRDLLGIRFRPADDFPNDDSGYGFDNIGDVLSLSPVLMEKYLTAAENISAIVLPNPRTGRPALNRVPSDRATPDPSPGGIVVNHRAASHSNFELHIRMIDRRRDLTAPPVTLALFIDDTLAGTETYHPGQNIPNRLLKLTTAFEPGDHILRAVFLDADRQPVSATDPLFAKKTTGDISARDIFVDYIEIRGPYPDEKLGPPPAQKQLLVCTESTPACATQIVASFLPKAWRRPVTPAEIAKVAAFSHKALADGAPLERAMRFSLQAALVSPHFLFRIENSKLPANSQGVQPISDFELASRLSYFLWSSMPDEELFRLAQSNQLRAPQTLRAQISRMLADPRSAAFADNFAGQWLQLRNLESHRPDPKLFADFDESLRAAMATETRRFFEHILRANRPVTEFLDAPYTFLNERLAAHYGIEGVTGSAFRQVQLDTPQRGGILSHASVLTVSSYPTRTSPVIRGKWILENILGAPPPPPPPGVPELNEAEVGNTGSLRQQLEKHRSNASCAVCHTKMDALGFGLENYDPIGKWRTMDGSFPIDAAGSLPGKKHFQTPAEMRGILKADTYHFTRALAEKLLTYALGRGLEPYDRPAIAKIVNQAQTEQYKMASLIAGVVESLPFQFRRGATPPAP